MGERYRVDRKRDRMEKENEGKRVMGVRRGDGERRRTERGRVG